MCIRQASRSSWQKLSRLFILCIPCILVALCVYENEVSRTFLMTSTHKASRDFMTSTHAASRDVMTSTQAASRDFMTSTSAVSRDWLECPRKHHVVYIKTFKTASSTINNILNRVALAHNESVLLYVRPKPVTSLTAFSNWTQLEGKYNMLHEHVFYNASFIEAHMQPHTLVMTSLRQPWRQLWSALHYSGFIDAAERFGVDAVKQYFDVFNETQRKYWTGPHQSTYLLPRFVNSPHVDLPSFEQAFEGIKQQLPFAIITEFFDESIVLLRRQLCWQTKDMLYSVLKQSDYTRLDLDRPDYQERHRLANPLDYLVYEHYNRTLHRMIATQPADFQAEVRAFKALKEQLHAFCDPHQERIMRNLRWAARVLSDTHTLTIPQSRWSRQMTFTSQDCVLMSLSQGVFRTILLTKQYPQMCEQRLDRGVSVKNVGSMGFRIKGSTITMNPIFCESPGRLTTRIATNRMSYDWKSLTPITGGWTSTLRRFARLYPAWKTLLRRRVRRARPR